MVNAGRILILAQGEWDNLKSYVPLDLVSKGETAYLARKASVGVDPETDVEMFYWQPFGSVAKIATTEVPGLVMPDGTTITIDSTGLIQANLGIADIKDVDITNVADGSVIRYDLTSNKWKNVTLGASAYKGSTNAVTQGSSDLVESGAVYTKTEALNSNKQPKTLDTPLTIGGASKTTVESALAALNTEVEQAYQTDNPTETALANNDLIPFYDTSSSAKKKMTVTNVVKQTVSNPNLLDNAWFTVNQRGASFPNTPSVAKYLLDRWRFNAGGTVTYSNGILKSNAQFLQYLPDEVLKNILGKTVTASYLDENNVVHSGTAQIPSSLTSSVTIENNMILYNSGGWCLLCGPFSSVGVKALKLEIGTVSTLAMDVAPNYAEELLKCQRYYFKILVRSGATYNTAFISSYADQNYITGFPFPVEMRATPSISNIIAQDFLFSRPAITGITAIATRQGIEAFNKNGAFVNTPYYIQFEASADL